MFVFIITILLFLNCLDPTYAYFENGDIGSGLNNTIGAVENTCIKRFNLNKLSEEGLCNFDIVINDVKNRWENGKYVVKVIADLPNRYIERTVNNKCVISIFGKCISFKESVKERLVNSNWEYAKTYTFKDNPEKSRLKVVFYELTSEFKQSVNIDVPQAKYPIGDFQLPLEGKYVLTQEFGKTDFSKNHTGIDFAVKKAKVYSVADGIVEYAGEDINSSECNNGGNIVRVKHRNGIYSAYFHLEKIKVEDNDEVKKGQIIGISGNSGKYNCGVLGYHLHFELRDGALQKDVINPSAIFLSI